MNQFDLWASPMRTIFTNNPPQENFQPWTHVPAEYALTSGTTVRPQQPLKHLNQRTAAKVAALRAAWLQKKTQIFAGKWTKPDSEDPDTRQPLRLVRGHRVYAALSRRENRSAPERLQQSAPTTVDKD